MLIDGLVLFKKHWKSLIIVQIKVYVAAGLSLWLLFTLASLVLPLNSQFIFPLTWFDLLDTLGRGTTVNAFIAHEMTTFFKQTLKKTHHLRKTKSS